MTFTHPDRLWLLAVVGVMLATHVAVQARRGRYAMAFSDTSLFDSVAPRRPGWRRHLVAITFLTMAAMLVLAFAGPVTDEQVARERAIVMLTIDTSLSMGADDVEPTRIGAAQQAAREFLRDAPEGIDIGLVTFDEAPQVAAPPTSDRSLVEAAIDRIELGPFTNTGDAIAVSLNLLARITESLDIAESDTPPAVVVLLSDGDPTIGLPIETAVAESIRAGIPVSTVSLGTAEGKVTIEDPDSPGASRIVDVPVDEAALSSIAEETGGRFFSTSSANELAAVYEDIGAAVGFESIDKDISDTFVALALALTAVTSALSLLWFQRLP